MDDLWIRYRADEFPWSDWLENTKTVLVPGVLNEGEHTLEVQVHHAKRFILPETLRYRFDVAYDARETYRVHRKGLDSDKFVERDNAQKGILSLGPCAVQLILEDHEERSKEVEVRLAEIVSEYVGPKAN